MEFKICIACKQKFELSKENFALTKRSKDGFSNTCKPCKREYDKEYRKKNKERIAQYRKEHYRENKEQISAYQKDWRKQNAEHIKQYRLNNKEIMTERNKKYWAENKGILKTRIAIWREENKKYIQQYRKDNRERDREQQRKWYNTEKGRKLSITKNNKRRAKIKQLPNDLTAEQWNECLEHFGNNCAYCGMYQEKLEQEHFVPISKGGAFTKSNIVPSCRNCNASKINRDFFEWYKKQDYYSFERELKILKYLGRDEKSDSLQI